MTSIGRYDLDEHLLDRTREEGRPHLNIYRHPGTAVVLGRGSDEERELHLERCLEDGVPLLRRRGGGAGEACGIRWRAREG